MSTLPLFPEPPSFRERLAARLAELAARGILIGTSSWKYPGWMGQIYTEDRYKTRGRFSQKRFEETCLTEYAETFPIVCGDFAFYQFPSGAYWQRLFALAPPGFRFAFKVPEEITVKRWPKHARYGSRAGLDNPSFLDATMFERLFLDPLAAYGERLALLIFEFGTFSKSDFESVEQFAEVLHAFLACLPERCRYAVEIRNREYLDPAYFDCLRQRGVAHVFNAWTRMPELDRQMRIDDAYAADFTVTRALLAAGRTYEQRESLECRGNARKCERGRATRTPSADHASLQPRCGNWRRAACQTSRVRGPWTDMVSPARSTIILSPALCSCRSITSNFDRQRWQRRQKRE